MTDPGHHRRRARPTQVNCDAVQEAISALLDNETAELDAKTISRHLSRCPGCQQFRQAWQEPVSPAVHLVRQWRLGPAVSPPATLTELATREHRRQPPPLRPPRRLRHYPKPAIAIRYLAAALPAAAMIIYLQGGLVHHPHPAARPQVSLCKHHPADLWVSPEITAPR